jgi:hypothetical protein
MKAVMKINILVFKWRINLQFNFRIIVNNNLLQKYIKIAPGSYDWIPVMWFYVKAS